MTTKNEIKTLTKVCELILRRLSVYDDETWGCTQKNTADIFEILDTLDASDDEQEKPVKCEHEKTGNKHTQFVGLHGEWWIYHCGLCGAIGRRKPNWESQVLTEWWPEVTT